jgi:hypothetical protein
MHENEGAARPLSDEIRSHEGHHVLNPGVLVEVDGEKPARLIFEQWVHADHTWFS